MKMKKLYENTALNLSIWLGVGALVMSSMVSAQSLPQDSHDSHIAYQVAKHELVEIQPSDFKPAFTKNTVLKLNSIVERAHSVIGEFDEFKKELKSAPKMIGVGQSAYPMLNKSQQESIRSLESRSTDALSDMSEAVAELKAGEEYYNPAVLAGMLIFVTTVEGEINQFYRDTKHSEMM